MKCPYCKESIKNGSLKCKHCHADLSTEEAKKLVKEVNKISPLVKYGGGFVLIIFIAAGISGGSGNMPSGQSNTPSKTTFESSCLSSWDGSFKAIFPGFKNNLKDPSSFEHVETRYSNENDGKHIIVMHYRAKNGFGAIDLGTVKFTSNDNCEILGNIETIK